ncbi:4Fe-4S dicluster domain-containing protein [Halobacteriaceae archaeon GCM10025711]
MSEQWTFYFDPNRCIGCHACAIACKEHNGVSADEDVEWRRVEHVGTGSFPDYEEIPVSISCMHCSDPPCEKVCPANAITKRDSDGIVTVDRDACIGCHYCGWACPYGAPQYGDDGKMQKCHLCLGAGAGDGDGKPPRERPADGGATPACVDNCVGGALDAGPVSEVLKRASEQAAAKFAAGGDGPSFVIEPTAKKPIKTPTSQSDESEAAD